MPRPRCALALGVLSTLLMAALPAPGAAAASALPAPKPARRAVPHPQPAASPARVVVRRLDLGERTSTRGWSPEEDTSTQVDGGSAVRFPAVAGAAQAPAQVYETAREGDFHTVARGLLPSTPYTLRLHLAEGWWADAGRRLFDVTANGATVLAGVDVVALAGDERLPGVVLEQLEQAAQFVEFVPEQFLEYVESQAVDAAANVEFSAEPDADTEWFPHLGSVT